MFAKLKGLFRGKKPETAPEKAGRKLTAAERREIRKVIEAARGDGKPHSAQDTLPFRQMYPDGLCRDVYKRQVIRGAGIPGENPVTDVPYLLELTSHVLSGTHDIDHIAVSYTHLDVYKRQVRYMLSSATSR